MSDLKLAIDLDLVSETAWLGATGWLDAGGPHTLAYSGGPEDAQGEWNEALQEAATEEVLFAGFDLDGPGVQDVIWDAAWDAGHEHRGTSREPLGPDSPFSAISVRWREMFPEAEALVARLRRNGAVFGGQAAGQKKEDALLELRGELWAEIFKHGFRWSADEWWPVSADIAVSMYEALTVDQMCRLVWCLRWRDVAGATSLLDLVTRHDEKQGHSHFNRLTLRRELDGEIRIHIAQLLNPARIGSLREGRASHVVVRRRTGARQRSSRRRAIRVRGSRRVTSRSAGGGSPGDPDEPERAFGPLSAAAAAVVFAVAFSGNLRLASATHWEGTGALFLIPFVLIATGAMVDGFLGFTERLREVLRPIRSRPMPPTDPKRKALQDARRTQAKFEKSQQRLDHDAEARRDSFERARKAGATLREIGEAVGLHWTRVGNILKK